MRRILFLSLLFGAGVAACGEDSLTPNESSYQIVPPNGGSVSLRQDLTIRLRDSGMVVIRDDTLTLAGDSANPVTRPNPRMHFEVHDPDIAIIDPYGIVRGLKAGTTTVTAEGYDQSVDFQVNVIAYQATTVSLTIATQPNGRLIAQAQRSHRGIFWALPGDRLSAFVEGLVLRGTDTVYCNRCNRKTPAREQRRVDFRSLRPELLFVTNARRPFQQQTSLTATTGLDTDTAGRVTAFDTTRTSPDDSVGIVMEVPGDVGAPRWADTVYVRLRLRPIDSLLIDADSADFPPNNIDDVGTQRRKYPNSDATSGNFVKSAIPAFAVNVSYIYLKFHIPPFGKQTDDAVQSQSISRTSTSAERRNVNVPLVTWQSALPSYLDIVPIDFDKASVTGPCNFIDAVCFSPTSQTTRNGMVINCDDTVAQLPGLNAIGEPNGGFPLAFSGAGTYTIPSCVPTKTMNPAPGAFCTTASSTDLTSFCTVWIRATITDPATGLQRRDLYPISMRR